MPANGVPDDEEGLRTVHAGHRDRHAGHVAGGDPFVAMGAEALDGIGCEELGHPGRLRPRSPGVLVRDGWRVPG